MIYNKTNPYVTHICFRELLSKHGSSKQVYEVSLEIDSTFQVEPGDSIAIFPENDPELVWKFLKILDLDSRYLLVHPKTKIEIDLYSYLLKDVNFAKVSISILRMFLETGCSNELLLRQLIEDKNSLHLFLHCKDLLDVFETFYLQPIPIEALASFFMPLLPRFYSISSFSQNRVDLLVSLSSYLHHDNQIRYGVASHFLCHLAEIGSTQIACYVQSAHHFRLPEDSSIPIIMIGAGTGVAPYRAFMQQRSQTSGKNWLFFGEREKLLDFMYQKEWEELVEKGHLVLTTAFSRDGARKEYVQDQLLMNKATLWQWIQEGAYIYVCGDAHHMAKAVEQAFLTIFELEGNITEPREYLKELRKNKRYLADVY